MPARPANQHAQPVLESSHDAASARVSVDAHALRAHQGHAHAHPHVDPQGRAHAHGQTHAAHLEAVAGRPHGAASVAGGTRAERAATWLSLACAVHCLVMPVAISVMPLLGASGATDFGPVAETVLTLLVVASALAGVTWGYRRHRDARVVYATGLGLLAYLVGHAPGHAFGEALAHSWYGMALAILGALTLAGSSFLSARLSHACTSTACTH